MAIRIFNNEAIYLHRRSLIFIWLPTKIQLTGSLSLIRY